MIIQSCLAVAMEIIGRERHLTLGLKAFVLATLCGAITSGFVVWFFVVVPFTKKTETFTLFKYNYLSLRSSCACLIIPPFLTRLRPCSHWGLPRFSMLTLFPVCVMWSNMTFKHVPWTTEWLSVLCAFRIGLALLFPLPSYREWTDQLLFSKWTLGLALRQQEHHYRAAPQVFRWVEKCEWMSLRGRNACHRLLVFKIRSTVHTLLHCSFDKRNTEVHNETMWSRWSLKPLKCVKQSERSNILTNVAVASPKGRELS